MPIPGRVGQGRDLVKALVKVKGRADDVSEMQPQSREKSNRSSGGLEGPHQFWRVLGRRMKLHPIFSLKPIFETETYKRDMKRYFLHTDAKELL